jgi:tetratricopeptide (TPR) repeat protein
MKPRRKVEESIRKKLRFSAGSILHDRFLADVLQAQEESKQTQPALHGTGIRRIIMRSPIMKSASVAAAIAIAALAVTFWVKSSPPAYAVEQTYEALQNVRFLHIMERDEAGQVKDERWIEIGDNGYQTCYRQDNPAPHNFSVIEDDKSTAVYRHDKKAVIIYDRNDQEYQWVGPLGQVFEDLRQNGKILQENTEYKGRPAHKVWWPFMSAESYVDPETKLPMSVGHTELSYEEPPAGTFEITIPQGYAVLDKRPGAPAQPVPDWLQQEESAQQKKGECFDQGARALAQGDYAEAAKQLEQALGYDSWAPFWLGSAYYGLGKYDLAVENYTKLYKEFGGDTGKPVPFCDYARGLAYARSGNLEAAKADFQTCLPAMIKTLRTPSGGTMFEYADSPLIRYGQYQPGEREIVTKMINRLRLITGQNFGYDPSATAEQNEAAITAWEQWFKNDGQIKFTPDAKLLSVPAEWVVSLGWGRKSNQQIAAQYGKEWLNQVTSAAAWLKIGFALYDAGRYDEALAAFEKLQETVGDNQRGQAVALLWQGHVLDLLGKRTEAVAKYQKVADMGLESSKEHPQYGLSYKFSPYAQQRTETPFARVENADEN